MRLKGVMDYLMVVVGVLAALAALVLLVAFGVLSFEESPGLLSLFMSFPILVDIFVLSPGIPVLYLILMIVPLLMMMVIALRILIELEKEVEVPEKRKEAKYSLGQLIIFGIGATVGPSVFVVLPEAVKRYGFNAVLGVVLASTSALLLAFLYARMDFLTYKLGSPAVGGPAFVRKAYGSKHPFYLASRFSMWVANTSLAAFNMLILMDVVTLYVIPDVLTVMGNPGLAEVLNFPVRVLIFILTLISLKYARSESSLVRLQTILGPVFVALFVGHVLVLAFLAPQGAPAPQRPLLSLDALPAMAFVYMVIFGFQEIQSLAEGIPGGAEERERVLRKALSVSVLLPAALFIAYALAIFLLGEVPQTPIPAIDLTSGWARALTEGALLFGIATTFIPALVTASNHLREMLVDIFDVKREIAESPVGKYLVALFVLVLLSADATYLVELTDFGVLISMIVIAWSVTKLSKMAKEKERYGLPIASAALTAVAALVLALTSPDVAFGGVLFILAATMSLGVIAYELEVVEMFTLITALIALIASPSVIEAMKGLSGMGALPPTMVAFLPFAQIALDILGISTLVLLVYLAMKNRGTLKVLLTPLWVGLHRLRKRFT